MNFLIGLLLRAGFGFLRLLGRALPRHSALFWRAIWDQSRRRIASGGIISPLPFRKNRRRSVPPF